MNIICKYSGVEIQRGRYLFGLNLEDIHPIFKTKRSEILTEKMVHFFRKSESLEEKRLIFLGTLYATELVDFHCIAKPTLRTCEKLYFRVVEFAWWMDYAVFGAARGVSFPKFAVRPDTEDMECLEGWLESVEKIREEFLNSALDRERMERSRGQEARIHQELRDAWIKDRVFTPYVARWLLEFTRLDEHPQADLFKRILCVPKSTAFGIDKDQLDDLRELISYEMDLNHPLAAPIFGQLAQLEIIRRNGVHSYMIIDEEILGEDGKVSRKPLPEVYSQRMITDYGSTDEPKPQDFEKSWMYTKAKAMWMVAQQAKKDLPPGQLSPENPTEKKDGEQDGTVS